jgi:hypothetical protein
MKHVILLIVLYSVALFVSLELRPFVLQPPGTIADARRTIVGTWTNSEGSGDYKVDLSIDFHPDLTYTARIQRNNGRWSERSGHYDIDTTRDPATHDLCCTVTLSTDVKGGPWLFRGGGELYVVKGREGITKNWGLMESLLWLCVVPLVLLCLPARLLWRKVNNWFADDRTPVDVSLDG